jgi:hypothetical protein
VHRRSPSAARTWLALASAGLFGLAAAPAGAQDAGPTPTPPATCGLNVDDEGLCFGEVATWCSAANEGGDDQTAATEQLDCASLDVDGRAVDGRCVQLAGFGAWCGVQAGEPCLLPGGDRPRQLACLDGDALAAQGACDLVAGCTTTSGACAVGCDGDFLARSCAGFGQALGVDCAAIGARCESDACVDVPRDGPCSPELRCTAGLRCVGDDDGAGTCVPEPEVAQPSEITEPAPAEPAPGCASSRSRGSFVPLSLLLGLAFRRHFR